MLSQRAGRNDDYVASHLPYWRPCRYAILGAPGVEYPLGSWPKDAIGGVLFSSHLALAGGKLIANGMHRPIPSLLVVEPAGTNPFAVLGALPFRNISRIAVAGQYAMNASGTAPFMDPLNLGIGGYSDGSSWNIQPTT